MRLLNGSEDSSDLEDGEAEPWESTDWPPIQPDDPRKAQYFCWCLPCVLVLALLTYPLGLLANLLAALVGVLLYICCGCPCLSAYFYFLSWPWNVDLYTKVLFLSYQKILLNRTTPGSGPEDMPISKLRPKARLEKSEIAYALNIKVPKGYEEEFNTDSILMGKVSDAVSSRLALLPMSDRFAAFDEDEDPVEYMMDRLSGVYPKIYNTWTDKQSDEALTRFCLYGLAAHRLDSVEVEGVRHFVVRTNMLSKLSVREGFARYGGDVYFDANWRPVKIVDDGVLPLKAYGPPESVTTRPGDAGWDEAKFRFRSSLSVLVTLVDHLYGIHLQLSNLFVTALREQLSPDHPVRRFMTPFTFQTISVNSNAANNLVAPRAMAPRCFGFSEKGLHMAFAAAPSLLMSGMEVSNEDGGPITNRVKYIDYLREVKGIDTEYYRQSKTLWTIFNNFVRAYLYYYYDNHMDVTKDAELMLMLKQVLYQLEFETPEEMSHMQRDFGVNGSGGTGRSDKRGRSQRRMGWAEQRVVEKAYESIVECMTNVMYLVSAGHEQVGAVEAYVQDVSFCAFKWVPGELIGTKQTALAQGLLMSFTSTPMPQLLGADWTHLFPARANPPPGRATPAQSFEAFQAALATMSEYCDKYDAEAKMRPFPECFPMYTQNPKRLETSISV